MNVDVNLFSKENLPNVSIEELGALTKDEIEVLAKHYFYVEPILLIQPVNGNNVKSPATWRSLFSLLKLGKNFKIVGLLNIQQGVKKPQKSAVEPIVDDLSKIEFIAPETPIIASEDVSTKEVVVEVKKRGRKPKQ